MDTETLARLRSAFSRIARELNTASTGEGLTPTQASVLALIAFRGPIGVGALTELEGINPTMLSRVIGALTRLALVHRLPDPTDLRAVQVEATAEGHRMHERLRERRTQFLAKALDELPDDAAASLLEVIPSLELLVAGLRKHNAES